MKNYLSRARLVEEIISIILFCCGCNFALSLLVLRDSELYWANLVGTDRQVSAKTLVYMQFLFFCGALRYPNILIECPYIDPFLLQASIASAPVPTAHVQSPSYGVAVIPAVNVRPNVQYVKSPGGISSDTDVVVFGMKSVINF